MQRMFGLDFSIGPFAVQVQISFWLSTLLLGINSYLYEPTLIFTWILVVFFSILLHELGHAVVAQAYKLDPVIQLYWMGGMTIPTRSRRIKPWQDILLSLAGPFFGFVLGGLLFVGSFFLPWSTPEIVYQIFDQLLWVNIGWGVINLIPMLPLDGGRIMRSLWQWIRHSSDDIVPLKVSIGVGVLVGLAALFLQEQFIMLFALFFAFNNFMTLRNGRGISF
jgi:Zn-dependent protease